MKVDIWSDVVCPWCYIGKRRFEAALAQFPHRDQVEVTWKAFELDPTAESASPGDAAGGHAELISDKYGIPLDQAQQMLTQITGTAAEDGLEFHLDRAVHANTVDAHQLVHLALERGGPALQDAVKERLMRAYFTEGEAVGDRGTLVRLAVETGLDADEVRAVLDEGRLVPAVREDEAQAAQLGIRGVPFFVVDQKYGVSGAQSAEVLLQVLQRSWDENQPLTLVGAGGDATACGPDGCTI